MSYNTDEYTKYKSMTHVEEDTKHTILKEHTNEVSTKHDHYTDVPRIIGTEYKCYRRTWGRDSYSRFGMSILAA